jgi:hypothetical protein
MHPLLTALDTSAITRASKRGANHKTKPILAADAQ